ncbi:MAG: TusE/DsrC/DsvC family sulfur relay protein [Gammaproteobacteria bacterium]|nr:TusE/DsrC/DsvC family sulfur relay protein [Gammaproteobacteria bacterium]MCB1925263.1 TusE/DsrC/DsvC family sulfur relay protein [Gammaproteobacteria bacterium]
MSVALATRPGLASVPGLPVDDDGFLLERRHWDQATAQRLADIYGIGRLDATHWMIIEYVRDKYFRLGAMPPMRNMCSRLGVERGTVKQAFGTCRQLWQIAGLPNPGPEALSYMV